MIIQKIFNVFIEAGIIFTIIIAIVTMDIVIKKFKDLK